MDTIYRRITGFIKKETVLSVSLILAVISAFYVHPSTAYLSYIDYRVLAILFCLMIIVSGLRSIGVFDWLGHTFLSHTRSNHAVSMVLVLLCFFSSMVITNDVALLTFVPFSILILDLQHRQRDLIWLITLETIAANLGSMLTPLGNPQNLYLYTISGMAFGDFVGTMLPYTLVSLLMLCGLILIHRDSSAAIVCDDDMAAASPMADSAPFHHSRRLLLTYLALFLLSLLVVFHVLSYWIALAVVIIVIALCSPKLFATVDYSLLATFVCFFVFIGNMKSIPAVCNALSLILSGHEVITGVLASQIISNVPAAILLSGFTDSYRALLIGVNVGGLGTLIASLASLISYRFYTRTKGSHKGKYLLWFTLYNLLFLGVLLIFHQLLT